MSYNQITASLILVAILFINSCSKVQKVTDAITQPSEREIYAREFEESDSLYVQWVSEYQRSKSDSLYIDLPYVEQGSMRPTRLETYSYNFEINEGERLILELDNIPDSSKLFVNLFLKEDLIKSEDSKLYEGLATAKRQVVLENGANKIYNLILQPELSLNSAYRIKIYTEPIYAFPVVGHNSKSIQSFWGASRDAGRRSHKGVDIFAKRGTPVIAVAKGRVSKTGNYGLGGKQVWLRESKFGNSLYYAHLDSINIKSGTKVVIGDTLGFVGNTGNAKTTAPHLHFGIYKGYSGASDPLPYIKETELLNLNDKKVATNGTLINAQANIRQGSSTQFNIVLTTSERTEVSILGKTKDWYHIVLPNGDKGYVHQSLIKENILAPIL